MTTLAEYKARMSRDMPVKNKCHHENMPINVDPLKAHFYIVKLAFIGVYMLLFFISAKNIDCGYSLEPPLTCTSNLCFEQKCEKYITFLSENLQFLEVKFYIYWIITWRRCYSVDQVML